MMQLSSISLVEGARRTWPRRAVITLTLAAAPTWCRQVPRRGHAQPVPAQPRSQPQPRACAGHPRAPQSQPRGNAAAAAALAHGPLNTQQAGSPESRSKGPDLAALRSKGYLVYPLASLNALNSDPKARQPDRPLPQQGAGAGKPYDVVTNGGFTFDTPGRYHMNPAGPIMRDGHLDSAGLGKTAGRGGVAVLQDGSIVVGRQEGGKAEQLQSRFGQEGNPVSDFMGGGALLVENGKAVSGKDLFERQRFDQGAAASTGNGLDAQQMRQTAHTVVGIRDGQAWIVVPTNHSGRQIQSDLMSMGFDSVVKFDGGSGAFVNDGRQRYSGTDALGFGGKLRR
jgi:hypothetical protein